MHISDKFTIFAICYGKVIKSVNIHKKTFRFIPLAKPNNNTTPTCVITVGASGCGKSTYVNKNFCDYAKLCMDDMRKELTGSVSDQSKNKEVHSLLTTRLKRHIAAKDNIALPNTNLNANGLVQLLDMLNDYNVILLLFDDSLRPELCAQRVTADINNGQDRANTAVVQGLIENMSERYVILCSIQYTYNNVLIKII